MLSFFGIVEFWRFFQYLFPLKMKIGKYIYIYMKNKIWKFVNEFFLTHFCLNEPTAFAEQTDLLKANLVKAHVWKHACTTFKMYESASILILKHGVQWQYKNAPYYVDPATLTPTGHFGSPSVKVQPISAGKTCTELKTCECFNVRLVSKKSFLKKKQKSHIFSKVWRCMNYENTKNALLFASQRSFNTQKPGLA